MDDLGLRARGAGECCVWPGTGHRVLLGLLSGGGSILAVPALVYGVGVPLAAAVPTSLLVVGISSAAAVLPRWTQQQVQWRLAAVFGLASAGATFGGAAVNRLLEPRIVLVGVAVLMVAAGVAMLREPTDAGGDCALPCGGVNWRGAYPRRSGSAWLSDSSPACSGSEEGSCSSPRSS